MFNTEHEALAWEASTKERLSRGQHIDDIINATSNVTTLDDLYESVRVRYWNGTANSENAVRNAEEVVSILGGHRDCRSITATDIDDLVLALRSKGNAPGTINRKLAALSKMLTHALSRGLIDRKPIIDRQRETQGRLRWYSRAEESRILDAAARTCSQFHDVLVFLLDTGCRTGEAWAVLWADCDDEYVRFHGTKSGRSRAVPMTPRVRAMLNRRKQAATTPEIFPGWNNHYANRMWSRVRHMVGLTQDPEAVLHAFRHTCASRLVQGGAPIQAVQQWLGHQTLTMTMRYAHLSPQCLTNAAKILSNHVTEEVDTIRCASAQTTATTAVTNSALGSDDVRKPECVSDSRTQAGCQSGQMERIANPTAIHA